MSFAGQVLCQRMLIGPWALAIMGKPRVAAPAVAAAAPARNLRREAAGLLNCSLLIGSSLERVGNGLGAVLLEPGKSLRVNASRGWNVPASALPGCCDAKARESYSYTASKSSRVKDACTKSETGPLLRCASRLRRQRSGWNTRLVRRIGMPSQYEKQHEETEHVGEGHVPAVVEPAPDRPRLGIHVRQRHAGARAEPDHRAAESDGISEIAPIVTALFESERGQRNVVEHGRNESESQRRTPRCGGQLLHRH